MAMEFDRNPKKDEDKSTAAKVGNSLSAVEFGSADSASLSPAQRVYRRLVEANWVWGPDDEPHVWRDESSAPPIDREALFKLASDERAIAGTVEFDADGDITQASFNAAQSLHRSVPKDEAERLYRLIDEYKSWALAWADLTADDHFGPLHNPNREA